MAEGSAAEADARLAKSSVAEVGTRKRILVVEDEKSTRAEIARLLAENDYQPLEISEFDRLAEYIEALEPDLILLDLGLPGLNGQTALKNLRTVSDVPVIILTSQNSETNEALTMAYGADDFVAKPFSPEILLLRIRAVLKRMDFAAAKDSAKKYRGLTFDPSRGLLGQIALTKTEILIFAQLLEHRGRIVSRQELMTLLWNNASFLNDNTLSVNISRLRDKLAKLGIADGIETRKGMGYVLK